MEEAELKVKPLSRLGLQWCAIAEALQRIAGATELRCPRREPWGPSVSINQARVESLADDQHRIEIEMQSGDVLEVCGTSIELVNIDFVDEEPT